MTSPEDDAINAIQSATIAIETELGIDPKGIYSDVATRLSILESRVGPGRGNGMGLIDINTQTAGNLLVNRISPSFVDGYVIATIGGVAAWSAIGGGALGGDLSGVLSNANVIKIQNHPVNGVTPTDGYVLTWDQADGYWLPKINTALPAAPDGYLQYRVNANTFGSTQWQLTAPNQITVGAGQQLLTALNNAGTFNYNIFAKDFLFGKDILQIGGTFLGTANTAFDRTTVSATQLVEAFAYDGYTISSISLGTSAVQTNGHGPQVAISPNLTLGSLDTNHDPYAGGTNCLRFFNAVVPTGSPNSGNLIWSNNGFLTSRNAGGYTTVMAPQSIAGTGANPQGISWAVNMQQTIGVAGANLGAVTPASNTACIYTASVVGIDIADGYMASSVITGAASNIGGTVTLIGTPTIVLSVANGSDAALTGCTVNVGTNGGATLLITVVGVSGKTINWTGDIMVRQGG